MREQLGRFARRGGVLEVVALAVVLAVATVVRFAGLAGRGTWDKDQGYDMLVLHRWVHEGIVPLLGPPTSMGDVHHGAWYYYLLAPAAALSGASPEAVVETIAIMGVAAVAATWWTARTLGGPVAGFVAALAIAVSATAIEQSTFIWNPNILALSSGLALLGAWRAWATGRARWWLVAAAGLGLTMQAHVLGAVLLPPLAALLLLDARRQTGERRRRVLAAGLGGIGVLGIAFLPLLVHELSHDFGETRAALAWLAEDREVPGLGTVERSLLVGLRVLAWPLTGLITEAPAAALAASATVVAILAVRARQASGTERVAVRWIAATLAWGSASLALVATSLATVTPGLPNDHYHSFLDPLVFVAVGLGAAALWRWRVNRTRWAGRVQLGRVTAVSAVASLVLFSVGTWPPAVAGDGGWPVARTAAERIRAATGAQRVALVGLPAFKAPDAVGYPLTAAGTSLGGEEGAGALVIVCDSLFEAAINATCGGSAESVALLSYPRFTRLVDRFPLSARTTVSVYLPDGP